MVANPLVSIIIPTYNYGLYLSRALESCLDQSYPSIEVIVVDDGSTDDTKHVVERYGSKVTYLYQENKGVSTARNTGLDRASGEFVTFLDSDDYLTHDSIKLRVNVLARCTEIGVVTGEAYSKDTSKDDTLAFRPTTKRAFKSDKLYEDLLIRGFSFGSALIRAPLAKRFRFPVDITNGEDIAYYAKVFFSTKVYVLPDPLVVKVRHPGCLHRDMEKITKQGLALISAIMDDPFYGGALEYLRPEFTANRYLELFRSLYLSGDFRLAREHYLCAVRIKPTVLTKFGYLTKFLRSYRRGANK
ncbi:glycosyltransferase family 2 protein [Syntrophorhabdus aromaticivorans]|jgi:glycosyltransferase involved in cell wall biosynthesis|uniref:Glycosyltransferase family 2 protein n=1 Tax=Syntrophorhabdus aromaticivorans TaxID=328301 RepID=A0A971M630_9BACT|nr:glycosyltransferase family A protein [Syntrophorhabdus aromaticivorans]NLW36580.1 glycosyltransferase family 2 protein [Syntrophorhabdus aromaticivorans]